MPPPRYPRRQPQELAAIVRSHLGSIDRDLRRKIIKKFVETRRTKGALAIDQLLNALQLIIKGEIPEDEQRERLLRVVLRELEAR